MHRALPAAVLLLALALPAAAGELPRGVAGITLGLSVNQAHARLARIGVRATETEAREREAGPGVEQEMWTLRDPRYAYLQVLVGPDGRVRMVEAWVRKGGPGLLFRDIADVREARRLGFWIYRWSARGRGCAWSRSRSNGTSRGCARSGSTPISGAGRRIAWDRAKNCGSIWRPRCASRPRVARCRL